MKRPLASHRRKNPATKQETKIRHLKGLLKKLECSMGSHSESGAVIVPQTVRQIHRRIIE